MRDSYKEIVVFPIDEARRYVENAAKTLKENARLDKESNRYEDPKHVKAAGNYLWLAVLIALDAAFHVKESKKKGRVDIGDYKAAVAQRDQKLLKAVTEAYNILHLDMTYDGISHKDLCDLGFRLTNDIINRCAAMLPK